MISKPSNQNNPDLTLKVSREVAGTPSAKADKVTDIRVGSTALLGSVFYFDLFDKDKNEIISSVRTKYVRNWSELEAALNQMMNAAGLNLGISVGPNSLADRIQSEGNVL